VIENKVDYGKKTPLKIPEGYELLITDEEISNIIIRPISSKNITTTIITYGGTSDLVYEYLETIFYNYDELVQVLVLSKIDPLPERFILDNLMENTNVITIEEGSSRGSIGDNIISLIAQNKKMKNIKSLNSLDICIPSTKSLEEKVLINVDMIFKCINSFNNEFNR
jgi:pyruvate/2-oxoglutarate/acetoin dehydrogenase E1 component